MGGHGEPLTDEQELGNIHRQSNTSNILSIVFCYVSCFLLTSIYVGFDKDVEFIFIHNKN